MRGVFSLMIFLFVALENSIAQIVPLYPDVQATYHYNMSAVSPAFIPDEGKYVFGGIYKFKPGEPNLAIYDANAAICLRKAAKHTHLVRVNFSNEKEGPYISTPRANLSYAYQLFLSDEVRLATGIALGYVSRVYSAPSSTGQGNVFLPDGNLGLELSYKKNKVGVTASQFLNSEGAAIESKILLKTYYQFYVLLIQSLSPEFSVRENLLVRLLPQITNQFIGGASLYYRELYSVGFTYYQRRGTAFHVTAALDNEQYPLSFSVGYNSSFLAQSPVWVNSFELGLNYIIP